MILFMINVSKKIIGIIGVIAIIVILFIVIFSFKKCNAIGVEPHFTKNFITGECNLSTGIECTYGLFETKGCDLSDGKKLEIIKNDVLYDSQIKRNCCENDSRKYGICSLIGINECI
jgi:hypothetical protein